MSANNNLLSKIRQDIQNNPYRNVKDESTYSYNSSSFYYDNSNSPLKSTQQLNIDWSAFENHTFFMSAEVKVNLAFEQIINRYPFDGTKEEIEKFLDGLTGYDKWVFDSFPRNSGSLHFNNNSYIEVIDSAGNLFPDLAKNNTGESVLNPQDQFTPLSIEAQLFVPKEINSDSVICQKSSSDEYGFSLNLLNDSSTTTCKIEFTVCSGAINLSASGSIEKGKFNHVCGVLWRDSNNSSRVEMYVDNNLTDKSKIDNIGFLPINSSKFIIGSGSSIWRDNKTSLFTPTTTLSGTLDELRLFHSYRNARLQNLYGNKTIFPNPANKLKLYYKFNEPVDLAQPSSNSANSIVLDSSGNSLHAYITNYDKTLRKESGVLFENKMFSPVLFPGHTDVINLNQSLLYSASLYDNENPNLITKLIPHHYLLEGSENDGFGLNVDGNATSQYTGNSIPGSGKLGSQQIILSFLYIWAKFFDEMKLFVDQFSNLNYVDYDANQSIPDNFLDFYSKQFGLNLNNLFSDSTVEQYLDGENISREIGSNQTPLKYVQNEIKRRVLVSLPNILSSKGTQHSIKAFLRAVGIEPDNSVRIREYGGPTKGTLNYSRNNKSELAKFLQFQSGSLLTSNYLSGSRVEPGVPAIKGNFITSGEQIISNNSSDGLFTSGSWSCEGIFKFDPASSDNKSTRNLLMLMTTGSAGKFLWCNLTATPNQTDLDNTYLNLLIRTHHDAAAPVLNVEVPILNKGIFDGEPWHIIFGRTRKDFISNTANSSSYYLRVGKSTKLLGNYYEKAEYFSDDFSGLLNIQSAKTVSYNSSGSFLVVGNTNNLQQFNTSNLFLNGYPVVSSSYFDGSIYNLRFWSKSLTKTESKEHINNPFSTGVELPSLQYNYVTNVSGSFQKLRLDAIHNQDDLYASGSTGEISLLDFSDNNKHLLGTNFLTGSSNFNIYQFNYSHVSPNFDEISSNQKIRVRGFEDIEEYEFEYPWARSAPVHQIPITDLSTDNNRFSIDFSLVDSLNRDIANSLFATFEELNNGLGGPSLMFSSDYPDIENLRNVYFNRLSDKVDFNKFFEFYRWFDTSISTFIDQLIPKRTLFKGINFVVEPHVLERGKIQYYFFENYTQSPQRAGTSPKSINWLVTTQARRF